MSSHKKRKHSSSSSSSRSSHSAAAAAATDSHARSRSRLSSGALAGTGDAGTTSANGRAAPATQSSSSSSTPKTGGSSSSKPFGFGGLKLGGSKKKKKLLPLKFGGGKVGSKQGGARPNAFAVAGAARRPAGLANVFTAEGSGGGEEGGATAAASPPPTAATNTAGLSKEEKFRLRRERLAAMMQRKKEAAALAAMTEEQRRRYHREQQEAALRREIEAKDRAFAAAEAERARRREQEAAAAAAAAAAAGSDDPLEQFMQQLSDGRSAGGDGAAAGSSSNGGGGGSSSSRSGAVGAAVARAGAEAPPAQTPRKAILTISFDDIVKQQQQQQAKEQAAQPPGAAEGARTRRVQGAGAGGGGGGGDDDDDDDAEDSDAGVTGGSFLDALDGSVLAAQNVALEQRADDSDTEAGGAEGVDDDTFHEAFLKELARRREAERLAAEANRAEEERQRALEEKERLKQAKATEGLGVLYGDADGEGAATYAAQQGKSALEILREKMKKKELKKVDHSKVQYVPIKKEFYREHPDVARTSPEVVRAHLRRLEIKIRGKHAPKPVLRWEHAGLDPRVMLMLQRHGFAAPFAIQAMALPALMSGRDIIGVAKTGSGKTVAFLLPLFRHVLDQPKLGDGEGPIGLIMAPARELAVQIFRETKKFTKVLGMRAVAVYGGSAMSEQINAMKRGAEIVVSTPGRFIDLLTLNAGKLISLARVSYLVLDEADRMFDMGFEPQIAMVTKNIRPDRQTAMFSATFPSHVERLARKLLRHKPLEIIVGGRSKVASEIEQFVEVRNAQQKFLRLLQILGLWQGRGSVLIFTDTQALCDEVFTKLMKAGYYCLSLHSGKDQADRDQTIADFKNRTRDIMVATSLAGRGLDVKSLSLVVNYSCPNHLEDYVQRCGRTGRAGNKGTAYTFVDPATEEQFLPDVVKALHESDVDVPQAVQDLHDQFLAKVKAGTAKKAISGYKGKGHKFDADEAGDVAVDKEIQRMRHEVGAGIRDAGDLVDAENELRQIRAEKDAEKEAGGKGGTAVGAGAAGGAAALAAQAAKLAAAPMDPAEEARLRAQVIAARVSSGGRLADFDVAAAVKAARMAKIVADLQAGNADGASGSGGPAGAAGARAGGGGRGGANANGVFEEELEINDYPQKARFRVMHRDCIQATQEFTGCAIISKGVFVAPGRKPKDGERKLYLLIQGATAINVKRAKAELLRVLEEVTMELGFDKSMLAGKYSVA